MKLTEFSGEVDVFGIKREVDFRRITDLGPAGKLTIAGVSIEVAQQIVSVLQIVSPEQAQSALLKDQTAALSGTAAAVGAVVAEKAPEPPKERKKRTEVVQPVAANGALAGKLQVVGASGELLAHGGPGGTAKVAAPAAVVPPAADDLEEDDDELLELAGSLPDWQKIPVDEAMKTATKATPVFRRLALDLKMDVDSMVAFCKAHQAEIPALAGDPSALSTRVQNAHRVLTAQTAG